MKVFPKLPPEAFRTLPLPNGVRPILWELVDPWLGQCVERGEVAQLAQHLGIAASTLLTRRRTLKFPPLPSGRPPSEVLTARQDEINKLLADGKGPADIGRQLGVTPQSVVNTKKRIEAKKAIWDRVCKECGGDGVRPCGAAGEPRCLGANGELRGNHSHICNTCGGKGTNE